MSEFVTIKARPGSKKFETRESGMYYNTVSSDGSEKQLSKKYDNERFPQSKQFFRIPWSGTLRRWLLQNDEGKDVLDSTTIKELVKDCRFQYPKEHRRSGDYILEADIYDPNDAFFNHKKCYVKGEEGNTILALSDPLHKLVLYGLRKHPKFQIAGNTNAIASAGTRYIIVDNIKGKEEKKAVRSKSLEATTKFMALTADKKLKVALAMGLVANENIDPDTVDDLLYNAHKDVSPIKDLNITRQDLFLQVCNLNPEDLNLKTKISKAKSLGFLKKQSGKGWLLFGSVVGKTQEQVESYMLNPDHSDLLIRLEEALADSSK